MQPFLQSGEFILQTCYFINPFEYIIQSTTSTGWALDAGIISCSVGHFNNDIMKIKTIVSAIATIISASEKSLIKFWKLRTLLPCCGILSSPPPVKELIVCLK